jgi:choline-sulfatase
MSNSKQPNIILILSDQHNKAMMGCAGDPIVRTPNLDRLAENGVRFENAYCASPVCVASRTSFLSGLHITSTGCYGNDTALRSDRATFVHALSVAGYETVLAGRMHLVGPDQSHGFTTRLTGDITPTILGGKGVPYGELRSLSGQAGRVVQVSGAGRSSLIAYDEAVTKDACDYIRNYDQERPLFMTIGHYGPHCPYVCPSDPYDYYYEHLPPPSNPDNFAETVHPAIQKWFEMRNMKVVEEDDVRRARAAYYGLVELLDRYTGDILNAIESSLNLENTLIIYASDHGDMAGHNGLFWKSTMYEGSVGVPLIFTGAGVEGKGRLVHQPVSLLDFAPTLIELAGAPPLPELHGQDIFPLVQDRAEETPERAVVSLHIDRAVNYTAMVRKGDWKSVEYLGYRQPQLFNLVDDPAEQNDLGGNHDHKDLIADLTKEIAVYWDGARVKENYERQQVHQNLLKEWGAEFEGRIGTDVWSIDNVEANNYLV